MNTNIYQYKLMPIQLERSPRKINLYDCLRTDTVTYTKKGVAKGLGAEFEVQGSVLSEQQKTKVLLFIPRALKKPSLKREGLSKRPKIKLNTYFSSGQEDEYVDF